MRAKSLALIITGFVFFAGSSAQPNSAIDNCCFVNRQCATNQEWVAGWHAFQRNECPARQPAAPASAPAGQPIDNCCYVNRQCATNQDWVNGWHAFQRNECPARQPVAPASAPVSAPAGQPIDNCCFIDRQCSTDEEWAAGWHAFQSWQCFVPAPATGGNCCSLGWQCYTEVERVQGYWVYQMNQCAGLPQISAIALTGPVPRIQGSDRFVQIILSTLKLMKSIAPDWYNYVITGMDVIVEVPNSQYESTGRCIARAYKRERKVTAESCWIGWWDGDISSANLRVANMLGHEACHIHVHEEGKYFASVDEEEAECNNFGFGAEALLSSVFSTRLDPSRGTSYVYIANTLSGLREDCAEGYRADLFCPTLQKVESIWRNVPFAVFPPGA